MTGSGGVGGRAGAGRTGARAGGSGAGRWAPGNARLGGDRLAIGEGRGGDARGRHTTVSRELVHLPGGGLVIDTPGIRAVGLLDTEEALDRVFGDLQDLSAECRYADCAHDSEPDCAVTGAVGDGIVDARRVARYRALRTELAEQRTRDEQRERRSRRGRR